MLVKFNYQQFNLVFENSASKINKNNEKEESEQIKKEGSALGQGGTNPYALATVGAIALAVDDVTGIGAVDDIAIPFLYAAAATYDLTQRVYVTYTLTSASGQKYAGRASGFGAPYSVMMRRYASHHMKAFGYGNPTLDVWAQGAQAYPAIRGREQQLIDFYGGVGVVSSPKNSQI